MNDQKPPSPRQHSPSRLRSAITAFAVTFAVAVSGLAVPGTATADDISPNIVGGHRASEPYPGMVSLQYDHPGRGIVDWHTCGAALIERGWLATAAHCVDDPPSVEIGMAFGLDATSVAIPVAEKQFHVRIGDVDRTGGTQARVTRIVVNPDWTWITAPGDASDLALLKLDHQVEEQPFELAGPEARPGDRVRLLGWGLTSPDGTGTTPRFLQELDTTVVAANLCADAAITGHDICVDNPWGTNGPCFGDSGGPALKKTAGRWQLVGTTSRGGDNALCGEGRTVYTSTPAFRRWIYAVMSGRDKPKTAPVTQPPLTLPYEPGQASYELVG